MRRNPFTNTCSTPPLQTPCRGTPQHLPFPAAHACVECGTQETPEWRRGPQGKKSLCNACGLRYAKRKRHDSKAQNDSFLQTNTHRPQQFHQTNSMQVNPAQQQSTRQPDFMPLTMIHYVPLPATTPVFICTPAVSLQRDPRMEIANLLNPISEPAAESESSAKRQHFTM